MGTAIFTGVTGLLAFQRRLDVIASNIANVNTTGYRGARVLFQDLFSQTLQGASASTPTFGGSNAQQVGLGVRIGTIDVNFSQGSLVTTGISSDLAIQGSGFFVLNDGSGNVFSRDGSFSINADGFLVDPATGLFVQGFSPDMSGVIDTNSASGNISIPVGGIAIVQATTVGTLIGNLQSDAATGTVISRTIRVFDSLGTAREVTLTFTKRAQVIAADIDGDTVSDGDFNAWSFSATFLGTDVTNINVGDTGVVLFDTTGSFRAAGSVDGGDSFSAFLAGGSVSIPDTLIPSGSLPVSPFNFTIDFSAVTELSSTSDVSLLTQDGFPRGILEAFSIAESGVINGVFTNGLTRALGQVALANFANVRGLARSGSNLFRETANSGSAQIGAAGASGRGIISGGVLEGSNVDLATEFSNMIVTQRGFQANARTIITADLLLNETVNLIR